MNLNQVTMPSSDVARSIGFYERLGLRLIVKNLPHYARFECPDGDSTFSVEQRDRLVGGSGCIVYFECDDLDRAVAALKASGIQFDSEPRQQPWLWRESYLSDPDGNVICRLPREATASTRPGVFSPDEDPI
jgi:catechol 2,3-dioxygenase-like lactoylglutathione lyase family enzyme